MTKKFFEVWNKRVLGNKEDLEIGLAQLETEIRADERANAIDECIKALKGYGMCDLADKITLLEQLKEQK